MTDTHTAEQQDTVVVIEADAPEVEKQAGDKAAQGSQQAPTTDAAVADLKAQVEEQRKGREAADAARQAAERRAQDQARSAEQARKDAETARTEVAETQASSIEAGLQAAQSEASAGETEYKTAMEAGDFAAAAKAQRKMASAEARIVRLNEAKDDLEARKTEATIERTTEQRTEAPTGDPVENFLATRTDATRNWLRAHPDHARALAVQGSNPRLAAKLNAADSDAVAEGLDRDSDAYFAHVNKFLGLDKSAAETQQQSNGQQQNGRKRTGSPPVASVQASGGGTGGNSGTEVRLSAGEARAATDGTHVWNYDDPSGQKKFRKGDPIGTQEFARRKLAMQQQGLYDKVFVEQ